VTHFVYLIRGRKVGATRDRLRDRLREQGHDLPHRVTDDGRVLPGDPDVEVLAVYTGQSDERIGDAEWAFARAHRLSRETHFGDRAMMSERGRRGAAVANARRVRCPHCGRWAGNPASAARWHGPGKCGRRERPRGRRRRSTKQKNAGRGCKRGLVTRRCVCPQTKPTRESMAY
jgi:hypothetical protein